MPENSLGTVAKDDLNEDVVWIEPNGLDLARLNAIGGVGNTDALAQFEKEQLAREIADIERATAVLRQAQPALQSWIKPTASAAPKSRPLWLLIGVLWLSTAIVTAVAVVAIASYAVKL
jgi:hypothetical protein